MPTFDEIKESMRKGKWCTFKHKCADFHISSDGAALMCSKVNKTESKRKASVDPMVLEVKPMRLVVQKGEVERIICSVHAETGHLMINNTYEDVKERFYWDTIWDDVRAFFSSCVKCQKNRPFKNQPAVLRPEQPPLTTHSTNGVWIW